MFPIALLNESEQKTRKNWLRVLMVSAAFGVVGSFLGLAIADPEKLRSTLGVLSSFCFATFTAFFTCLVVYVLYHCAYKNPGTKYLTFSIITYILGPIFSLVNFSSEISPLPAAFVWSNAAINAVLCVILAVLSIRMRKINKRIQHEMLYGSEDYARASHSFQVAETCQELDDSFQQSTLNRSKKFVAALKTLYKKRKQEIAIN